MSDYDVGYGKPPKHSRFKKGVCPNPAGRGKRRELDGSEIMKRVLNASAEFRDRGKMKKATRIELTIRKLVAAAVKGDVASAGALLKICVHAERYGDTSPTIIKVHNALPDAESHDERWISQ